MGHVIQPKLSSGNYSGCLTGNNCGFTLGAMATIGDRVKEIRQRRGITQKELASSSGVSQQMISKLESGKSTETAGIVQLARALRVAPDWLADGTGAPEEPSGKVAEGLPAISAIQNVTPGPDIRGQVPLISWVQAGHAMEVVDLLHPGDGFEWVSVTCPIKRHTYALKVSGDSMAPDFPPGILIIVEPEMEADPGDFVIAKNGDEEATFKQLVKDSGRWFLKPLNERYPIIPLEGFTVIGVVREAVRRLR